MAKMWIGTDPFGKMLSFPSWEEALDWFQKLSSMQATPSKLIDFEATEARFFEHGNVLFKVERI